MKQTLESKLEDFKLYLAEEPLVYEACDKVKTYYPEYPNKPSKPNLSIKATSKEAREYADALEQYEKDEIEFRAAKKEHDFEVGQLNLMLMDYTENLSGVNNIPERYIDKVKELAWDEGHAYGYSEYYNELRKLVDLFK